MYLVNIRLTFEGILRLDQRVSLRQESVINKLCFNRDILLMKSMVPKCLIML